MTPDVNVILFNFRGPEREAVIHNEDDSYTIFINARLSHEGQLRAYEHAMRHITQNDFEKHDIQSIEAVAHEITENKKPVAPIPSDLFEKELRRLQRRKKQIQKAIQKDEERVRFLRENFDTFAIAEHQFLYGRDL